MSELLERLQAPDADAAEARGWDVARTAFAERVPVRRVRRAPRWAVAAAIAAAAALTALTPAGAQIGDWVRRAVDPPPPATRPALTRLPAAGGVLALAGRDLWLVHPD